jgi:hypothetical protein
MYLHKKSGLGCTHGTVKRQNACLSIHFCAAIVYTFTQREQKAKKGNQSKKLALISCCIKFSQRCHTPDADIYRQLHK